MSLSIEIIGNVHYIGETEFVTERFSKREFVLHIENEKNPKWDDYIQLQMTMDNCDLLDNIGFRDKVKVQVNLRGREYERKDGSGKAYFNSLDAWKIEVLEKAQQEPDIPEQPVQPVQPVPEQPEQKDAVNDDLPF